MSSLAVNDYVFYKIVCIDENIDFSYVGSTKNLHQRTIKHKSACNNPNHRDHINPKYQTIRKNGGWENFKLIQIGKREQITKREAEYIEEQYRINLRANMNRQRCYRTEEQYKDQRKQWDKEYYEANKQTIIDRQNIKITCECGLVISRNNLPRHCKSKRHIRFVEKEV
tara:strand:- start:30 stop:536 length:507 start_codon:yes stop_codon:yes gene_type:complete